MVFASPHTSAQARGTKFGVRTGVPDTKGRPVRTRWTIDDIDRIEAEAASRLECQDHHKDHKSGQRSRDRQDRVEFTFPCRKSFREHRGSPSTCAALVEGGGGCTLIAPGDR